MKNNLTNKIKWFTLIEIVVSITISLIIMGWVLGFLMKIQSDILLSKESTRVHTQLTDFIGTMHNFSKLYGSGRVIVEGTGVYNAGLLMRSDQTSWVLIGVVEEKSGNLSKLDPVINKNLYGKKVIAYQKLTASQISSILVSTGSVYNMTFRDEGLFKAFNVTDFTITPYNSGSLFEYTFTVETPFYENLNGQQRDTIGPQVTIFSFTLDF